MAPRTPKAAFLVALLVLGAAVWGDAVETGVAQPRTASSEVRTRFCVHSAMRKRTDAWRWLLFTCSGLHQQRTPLRAKRRPAALMAV